MSPDPAHSTTALFVFPLEAAGWNHGPRAGCVVCGKEADDEGRDGDQVIFPHAPSAGGDGYAWLARALSARPPSEAPSSRSAVSHGMPYRTEPSFL